MTVEVGVTGKYGTRYATSNIDFRRPRPLDRFCRVRMLIESSSDMVPLYGNK